jgi:beta-glucosidase
VGVALGEEAMTKGVHVVLAPTVNLQRHPLGGRNFESYGEDPHLVAVMGAAFVRGLQSRRVAACVKHLVGNDAEIERLTVSSEIDERTLREVYLRPFETALVEGEAWSVMGAYNRLNGTFSCEHEWLLTGVVKGEWGFDGLVMSDWYATHDTVRCARAGLDLEMPGPAVRFGEPLARAVGDGSVEEARVRDMARRVLRLADRVGASSEPTDEERSVDVEGHWTLAREAAASSFVLLRNEPVGGRPMLPLDSRGMGCIAVVGPNADVAVVQGGGSARVSPHRTVSPVEGLVARVGDRVEVVAAPGCTTGAHLPVLDHRLAPAGIRFEYRDHRDGPVRARSVLPRMDPVWQGRFTPEIDPRRFHVTARATLIAPRDGRLALGLTSVGACRVFMDGEVVLDTTGLPGGSSFFGYGTREVTASLLLRGGRGHELVVEYDRPDNPLAAFRLGASPPLGDDPMHDAAELATGCDVAVVVVGTDEETETEGRDRTTLSLPGDQDELVRRVAAANPRTVVVVHAGAPVAMPWADDVAAILLCWFPGMAGGEALARVLAGDDEPGGRLPVTWPASSSRLPCDIAHLDPPGHLRYTEGRDVGHRWYLAEGVTPRWWFGYGLGYGTTTWAAPGAPARWTPGEPLRVTVPVTADGPRAAVDVVQVYARRPASQVGHPPWVLAGLQKARVAAGETQAVEVTIDPATLRHWDVEASAWAVEPGPLELRVARHAGDAGQLVMVEITA